jgi:hypothetical protein
VEALRHYGRGNTIEDVQEADRCPADPEEVAESYCLGGLARADALTFEDHYATCARCALIVETTVQFMRHLELRLRAYALRRTI